MHSTVRLAQGEHAVSFYDGDTELAGIIASYLVAAVRDGDAVVLIAAPSQCASFAARLRSHGIDVDAALGSGALQLLDATETLALFMRDGTPSAQAFRASVGACLREAAASGRPVRAYGEMVALLWEQGNLGGAVALEHMWNNLADELPFSLLCTYPRSVADDTATADALASVCHSHSHVVAPRNRDGIEAAQRFAGSPRDAAAARRFTAEALGRWGLTDIVDDAVLIVSELTSNAIRHTSSPFAVRLLRVGDGVHIGVTDASAVEACLQAPDAERPGGRGLRVVDTLATRWGQTPVAEGKRVWAVVNCVGKSTQNAR